MIEVFLNFFDMSNESVIPVKNIEVIMTKI